MNALPNHAPLLSPPPGQAAVSLEELAMCVRALDPGSRALLDLSLRRRLPFEAMAGVLHTDPFDLARRRARAVARIAAELDLDGAGVVATVKAALARLPDDAWGVPSTPPRAEPQPAADPVPLRGAVQAESMAEAARALMDKLNEQRRLMREAALAATPGPVDVAGLPARSHPLDPSEQPTVEMEVVVDVEALGRQVAAEAAAREAAEAAEEAEAAIDAADQPTVESDAIVLPPLAATDMAAAFAHHPAFAVEADDAPSLPPLAEALARAAASERAAATAPAPAPAAPEQEVAPEPDPPTPPLGSAPHAAEREPRRRIARGGLLIGLVLALLRLLLGRR